MKPGGAARGAGVGDPGGELRELQEMDERTKKSSDASADTDVGFPGSEPIGTDKEGECFLFIYIVCKKNTKFLSIKCIKNQKFFQFYVLLFPDVFKKGTLCKGIFFPSLTNSFHSKQLENSYLQYSNRQRQKSLIMLNVIDLGLKVNNLFIFLIPIANTKFNIFTKKICLISIWLWRRDDRSNGLVETLAWSAACMLANLVVCALGWKRCFSNNYLYWASIFTWLLINAQGKI